MIKYKFLKSSSDIGDSVLVRLIENEDLTIAVVKDSVKEIHIGIGSPDKINRRKFIILIRKIIITAKSQRIKKIAVNLKEIFSLVRIQPRDGAKLFAENAEMANFEFIKYKTSPEKGWYFVEEISVIDKVSNETRRGIEEGQTTGESVNACRSLANTPGGEMTPEKLSKAAELAVKNLPVKVSILDKKQITASRMGGILGVSQGSGEEPKFIIMEYGEKFGKPLVLVGKGVTFDTGGLNIKTGDFMYEMHMDMSGGAAVINTVALAAKLGIKKRVIGLIPSVENMPSGESYRPGDVLKSFSGKTIEVINTDAEGRIILADAISYAKKFNPRLVMDVATLTGAAVAALGDKASAVFSRDSGLIEKIIAAGEESGDYVWPLPLWDEYEDEVKGTFGDIANASKSRYGGAINGAMFLYQFAKDLNCPWIHIDMAPRMTSSEGEFLAKGAAGAPIRLLTSIIKKF